MKACPACGTDNLPGAEECESCHESLSQLDLPQPGKGMQKKILEGVVSDLSPRAAVGVAPDDSIATVLERMREKRIGCVLVIEQRKLAGILTERDILFKVAGKQEPAKVAVKDVMKAGPDYMKEGDPINVAFHKMAVGGFRHLPIEKADGSFGIISARDLMAYLCK
jgi:CBS domain-containing protein